MLAVNKFKKCYCQSYCYYWLLMLLNQWYVGSIFNVTIHSSEMSVHDLHTHTHTLDQYQSSHPHGKGAERNVSKMSHCSFKRGVCIEQLWSGLTSVRVMWRWWRESSWVKAEHGTKTAKKIWITNTPNASLSPADETGLFRLRQCENFTIM